MHPEHGFANAKKTKKKYRPPNGRAHWATAQMLITLWNTTLRDQADALRESILRAVVIATITPFAILVSAIALLQPALLVRGLSVLAYFCILVLIMIGLKRISGVRAAAIAWIIGLMITITINALQAGGIRAPGAAIYFIIVFMAGLLLGERPGLYTAASCAVLGLMLVALEQSGQLPPQTVVYTPATYWFLNLVYLSITTALLIIGARAVQDSLSRYGTELKRSHDLEERLQRALDAGNIGIWDGDLKADNFHCDARCFHLLGLPEPSDGNLPISQWKSLIHPDDVPEIEKALQYLAEAPRALTVNYRIRMADGSIRHLEGTASAIAVAEESASYIGTLVDLTARKQVESELEAAARSLRTSLRSQRMLVECTELTMRATNQTDLIQAICQTICEVGGYSLAWAARPERDPRRSMVPVATYIRRDSAVAEDYVDALNISWDENSEYGQGPMGRAVRTGQIVIENDVQRSKHYAPWRSLALEAGIVATATVPLLDGDRVFGAIGIYSTRSNAFDSEEIGLLRQLGSNLSYGIQSIKARADRDKAEAERSALENQLRQSQKMEALGTLASGIAHDFNNILGVILGNVDSIRSSYPAETGIAQPANAITKSVTRGKDIVRQIMLFCQQQEPERRPTSLPDVIEDALNALGPSLPKNIDVKTRFDQSCPKAFADPSQVYQVIANLVANAADAMKAGGTLSISTSIVRISSEDKGAPAELQAGHYIRVDVSDTGVGMSKHTLSRLFEPFFTTKGSKGTGLGMAVVYGIVREHKGAIEVQSAPSKGTTFKVYFPMALASNIAEEEPAAQRLRRGNGEHVLLVEDQEDLAFVTKMAIERLGYSCSVYTNPTLALAEFCHEPARFDAAITDLNMPEINGVELAGEIKRIRPELMIAVTTGKLDFIESERKDPRVDLWLSKPASTEDLAQTLCHLVRSAP